MNRLFLIPLILTSLLEADYPGKDTISEDQVVSINYDLENPDKIYELPNALHEISGITEMTSSVIACIQDENGIIFFYDLGKEKIDHESWFYKNGDYEGATRIDKTLYILRSDGGLFEVTGYESETANTNFYSTGVPSYNIEGLCSDRHGNRLLLGPKGEVAYEAEDRTKRYIFAFDLVKKQLIRSPVFVFDTKILEKFASDNHLKVPVKHKKKGKKGEPDLEFRISEIGINPVTNKLFILSGTEHMLYVFDMKGKIEFMEKLDPDLYTQPEGLTFLKNGDMLISNESRGKKPTIVRCNFLR